MRTYFEIKYTSEIDDILYCVDEYTQCEILDYISEVVSNAGYQSEITDYELSYIESYARLKACLLYQITVDDLPF